MSKYNDVGSQDSYYGIREIFKEWNEGRQRETCRDDLELQVFLK